MGVPIWKFRMLKIRIIFLKYVEISGENIYTRYNIRGIIIWLTIIILLETL